MDWLAFLTYTTLTAFTPGPNNIMALGNAGRDGFWKTAPFLLGVFAGFSIVMGMCAVCTTLLFNLIPALEPFMVAVGAAYLIFLAWSVWRDKSESHSAKGLSSNSFGAGAALQLVNVKIMIYGVTALSSFVLPHTHDPKNVAAFAVLLAFIGLAGCVTWAGLGTIIERIFLTRRKTLNAILALLLVYCAVSLYIH